MQFDVDISSKYSDIFLRLRDILLSYEEITEKRNARQTAYYDDYSAICFLRSTSDHLTLSLANGVRLEEKFGRLIGNGKIVRQIHLHDIKEIDEVWIRAIIDESLILNIEKDAIKRLRH